MDIILVKVIIIDITYFISSSSNITLLVKVKFNTLSKEYKLLQLL